MKFRFLAVLMLLAALPTVANALWTHPSDRTAVFHTQSAGDVVFDHDVHFEALGSKHCNQCHNKIFNLVPSKNPVFTMADMEKGKACGACHNGEVAFSVKSNCAACHKNHDIVFKGASFGKVVFSHKNHTAMFGCKQCHPKRFIAGPGNKKFTMADMDKGEGCGGCHNGDVAFSVKTDCAACHQNKDIVFKGPSFGKVIFSHKNHTAMFGCKECHPKRFIAGPGNKKFTMADMDKGEACGGCHNGDVAFSVKTDCAACHQNHDIVFKGPSMGTVTFSHKNHTAMFGCKECHPKRFIAGPGNKKFTMADMDKGEGCGGCHNGDVAFSVKTDCATCHQNKDIVFKGPSFGKVVFSHKNHTAMFGCKACHPKRFIAGPGNKKFTMADMDKGEACGGCHNGDVAFSVKTDCAACHQNKDIVFKEPSFGKVVFSHKNHTAMFGCKACHPKRFIAGPGNKKFTMADMNKGEACGGCHNGKVAFSVKSNCAACHKNQAIKFKVPSMGTVTFSHKKHTARFGCKACHPKRFIAGPGNKTFTMADMDKGEGCGGCHNGKVAFSVKSNCTTCHPNRNVVFKGPSFGSVTFHHKIHTNKFGCRECHPKRFTLPPGKKAFTMADMNKGEACGGCHNGKMVFSVKTDCAHCHKDHDVFFKGPSFGVVIFRHKNHTAMFGCKECHPKRFIAGPGNKKFTMADMDKGEACGGCHNGKVAFSVKADCATCHLNHAIVFKSHAMGNVTFSHKKHTAMFGCKACHPKLFIPGQGNKEFTMAQMYQGKGCGSCHNGKTAFNVKDHCHNCHKK